MSETNQIYDGTNNNNNYVNNHVLIIGGGQVGLSFALLLAHHGIYSTLIEQFKYPTISPDDDVARSEYLDSRNTALSRRTVQIYTEIGLWESLQSHACRIDGVEISELGSFGRAKLDKTAEGVESFGQVMENAWLGRQLLLAVQAVNSSRSSMARTSPTFAKMISLRWLCLTKMAKPKSCPRPWSWRAMGETLSVVRSLRSAQIHTTMVR